MKDKNGIDIDFGDVIRWNCWDYDDFTTWNMTGLYTRRGVVYLGGGVDFGLSIGSIVKVDEVVSDSENNDSSSLNGVDKVGIASDLAQYINKYSA
tara:strand:+ start:4030 stop:4314 length:285 start_codon:yes stop_codon:yes gene_type:complete